jgi:hypothetical protein
MMKRKMLCAAAAGLMTLGSYGQEMTANAGRTTFGLRAGVNFQNINGKDASGDDLENKLGTGFHAGVNAEIPVGTGSYLQPGVLYSMKGAKWGGTDAKVKLSYIEIPVNFIYKPVLGTGNMVLGFGPYVAFGIGGKIDNPNGPDQDIEFTKDYDPTIAAPQLKRLDAGGNFLAGYEFSNKFSVQLNAQLGLVNINPEVNNSADDTRWRNTGWGVSLGYRF